jgi:hypothetical protein
VVIGTDYTDSCKFNYYLDHDDQGTRGELQSNIYIKGTQGELQSNLYIKGTRIILTCTVYKRQLLKKCTFSSSLERPLCIGLTVTHLECPLCIGLTVTHTECPLCIG